MKIISTVCTRSDLRKTRAFFLSPYLSQRSLHYTGLDSYSSILLTFILSISLTAIFVMIAHTILMPLNFFDVILISPVILFFTEAAGSLGQFLFYPTCPKSFPIHHRPLSSANLAQFWGRHWNLWVQDWLKDISHHLRGKKRPRFIMIFLASGFFHEVMVNLPYWIVYKKSYFGTMMLYFICQAIGLALEKRFLRNSPPFAKRLFMFLVIFLPSPLFVNVPVLTFLGFLNE